MATFDDFKKLEIIAARIESVREHPNADKLLILEVSTGKSDEAPLEGGPTSGGNKEIVAGIKNFYTKDHLIGKNIIMINNLPSVTIRGVQSNGMLLAVSDEKGISLIIPDKPVNPGSKIK